MPHFIFIQQISVLNILNMLYNVHFFSSKCRLFHNATLFGFCITHILNTGWAKIWKKKSVAKRLKSKPTVFTVEMHGKYDCTYHYVPKQRSRLSASFSAVVSWFNKFYSAGVPLCPRASFETSYPRPPYREHSLHWLSYPDSQSASTSGSTCCAVPLVRT
jgi:hypothetical protein